MAYAESQEMQARHALLMEAMETLNERERHILTERRLREDPVTLEELSQHYNVSRERIRQIEVRAFEKLQKKMRALASTKRMTPTGRELSPRAQPQPCPGSAASVGAENRYPHVVMRPIHAPEPAVSANRSAATLSPPLTGAVSTFWNQLSAGPSSRS